MTAHRRTLRLFAVAAALLAAASARGGETYLLSGTEQAAWLVINYGGNYELAVKRLNRPWENPWGKGSGMVTALAPLDDSAVLFFAEGGVVRHYRGGGETRVGARAPLDLWPEGVSAIAACAREPGRGDGALVLINRPVTPAARRAASTTRSGVTQPSSTRSAGAGRLPQQASAPAGEVASAPGPATQAHQLRLTAASKSERELALLSYAADKWELVSVVPMEIPSPGSRGRGQMVEYHGATYILLDLPAPALLALENGQWRSVPLPPELKGLRPVALAGLTEGLLAAMYQAGRPGRVLLSRWQGNEWSGVRTFQRIETGAPIDWPDPPAVAQVGQRLMLVWREDSARFYGTSDPDGSQFSRQALVLSSAERGSPAAGDAFDIFSWVVLGVVILLMLLPGRVLAGPFSLPAQLFAARLGRRGLAFLIDWVPISVLTVLGLSGDRDMESALESMRGGTAPDWVYYALMVSASAYTFYCIVMEHRYGATLGKMAMHLVVVTDAGARPRLRQIVLRNLTKIPELRTVILLLFVVFTRYRQRLGDKIARTAVIDADMSLPPGPSAGTTEDQDDDGSGPPASGG